MSVLESIRARTLRLVCWSGQVVQQCNVLRAWGMQASTSESKPVEQLHKDKDMLSGRDEVFCDPHGWRA